MNSYRIVSKAGLDFGVYPGATAEEAFAAMVDEAGGSAVDNEGNLVEGCPSDWIITEEEGAEIGEGPL